jgi:Fic family protein
MISKRNNMKEYQPPYTLTNRCLVLVDSIVRYATKIQDYSSFHASPKLRRDQQIQSLHSSLAIEANSLSLSQVIDVIDGKPVLGKTKDIWEVKDALAAYEQIQKINPFSLKAFLDVHGLMTAHTVTQSGRFRNSPEGVFSGERCVFMAPPASQVPLLMKDLFQWLQVSKGTVHPLIQAAVFHFEMVFIHPFSDGNGRMARYWQSALLGHYNPLFFDVPVENQIKGHQSAYYQAIAKSEKAGDSTAFIEFILSCIADTLKPLAQNQDQILAGPATVQKLLARMASGRFYSAKELLKLVHLKSKASFRLHYLVPALKRGYLEYEFPKAPTSPTQRYRKR